MKLLAFNRTLSEPLLQPAQMSVVADSAITDYRRPVFLPDFDEQWGGEMYLAVKISRLGKNISEKFAPRYYEEISCCLMPQPLTVGKQFQQLQQPTGLITSMDNAAITGAWLPLAELPENHLTINALNLDTIVVDNYRDLIAQAVSLASRYATLKTGDIILPCRVAPIQILSRGIEVECKMASKEVMNLKIH